MRILVYPATMEMGGSRMNALELAARVQARGHAVIVYGDDDVLVDVCRSLGLEFRAAQPRNGWPSFRDVAMLHHIVRRQQVQIVHAYEGGPALDVAFLTGLTSRVTPMTTIMSMSVPYDLPRHVDLFVGTRGAAGEGGPHSRSSPPDGASHRHRAQPSEGPGGRSFAHGDRRGHDMPVDGVPTHRRSGKARRHPRRSGGRRRARLAARSPATRRGGRGRSPGPSRGREIRQPAA